MAAGILHSNAFEDFQPDVASPTSVAKDSFAGRIKRIITSAVLLLVAYIIAFLLYQYVTGLLCIAYGYEPVISTISLTTFLMITASGRSGALQLFSLPDHCFV